MAKTEREGVRRRPTQADVAKHAGVSAGIVSSVVNGRDYGSIRISDATRQRVMRSVRELGYIPNIAARNLARGSNRLIAVFTYQPVFPLESRDFYHEFLIGIEEAAESADHNLMLVTGSKNESGRRAIYADGVNSLQLADGAVLVGHGESSEEIARLASEGYPFVFVGHREIEGTVLSYVAADYIGGTANVVRELIALGHRRVALVQSAEQSEPIPGRRAGFRKAREDLGLFARDAPVLVLGSADEAGHSEGEARAGTAEETLAWALAADVTALVVESSSRATELLEAARTMDIAVPRRMSVVGLSGAPERSGTSLAEIHIPRREMGQEAVRLLLRLLQQTEPGPMRTTLPCGLRRGATLAPAPPRTQSTSGGMLPAAGGAAAAGGEG